MFLSKMRTGKFSNCFLARKRILSRQQKTIPIFIGIKMWMNGLLGGIVAQLGVQGPRLASRRSRRLLSRGAPFLILGALLAVPAPAGSNPPVPRALFVSVIQDPQVLSSRAEIARLIDFAKQADIQILFVQIYRANKAWFPSQVTDPTPYKKCRRDLGEDPFLLLIKQAHREGLQVHAWLNLLSLANNADASFLKRYGTDVLTRNLKKKNSLVDFKIDEQYFLEPGDLKVRSDLTKMVEEILSAYPDLDGVQFDYIRYPDKDPHYGYTKINMERFKKVTGRATIDEESQVWKDWKRAQVTELLSELVKKARSLRPDIQVSATGCMPYVRAYYEAYQDWPSWLAQGLVDFVTIMSYSPDPKEFEKWIATAKTKVADFSKVKIGVGAYKLVHSPEIFGQEFRNCEGMGTTCVVFHYGSLLENSTLKTFLIKKKNGKATGR